MDLHLRHWPKHLPKTLTLPDTSVSYNLEVSAARYPDKALVQYYGATLTYREFKRQVDALAGFLQLDCGVKKGERVLLYMQNSPQFMLAFYAILRADAVVVPINPMNLTAELDYYLEDSDAGVAFIGQELYPRIKPLLGNARLRSIIVAAYSEYAGATSGLTVPDAVQTATLEIADRGAVLWRSAIDANHVPGPGAASAEDMAVLLYTSGTTGRPKGCIHTHRSTNATLIGGAVAANMIPDNVVLAAVPLFHVTGMQHCMSAPIYAGASVVVMTRWDREMAGELINRYGVTNWTNIPTMVIDLLSSPNMASYNISSLCSIGGGGASMPEAVANRLHELTGLDYLEGYGLSETMSQTHWNPRYRPKKQCLGMPVFDVDSRVIHPETLQELGPNEVGEIVSHGPQVLLGYWKNPKASEEAFIEIDGKRFFRTGDLGRYDDEGYFFIVDRLKRMINAAGFKVWPADVESKMYLHPDIQEACIIGAVDARKGETVKALIVLTPSARGKTSEQDIITWSKQNMAAYKCPSIVQFVDSLPKSATGKIQWRLLQEQERASVAGN